MIAPAPTRPDSLEEEEERDTPHLSPSFAWAVRALDHRAELAALELEEAGSRASVFGGVAMLAVGALLLAGFTLTFVVAAAVWDTTYRVSALAGLMAFYVLLGLGLAAWLRHRLRAWRPLESTLDQLRKDYQCMHQLLGRDRN